MMPYLSCKKIENDVYNFPTWQYCKYKDIFDSRIIINSTAKFYISISYQKDLLSIDTRIFTPSTAWKRAVYFFGILIYSVIMVPVLPFRASMAFSRFVMIAERPLPAVIKSTEAQIFGSMEFTPN